jgi:hypothetical protein
VLLKQFLEEVREWNREGGEREEVGGVRERLAQSIASLSAFCPAKNDQ